MVTPEEFQEPYRLKQTFLTTQHKPELKITYPKRLEARNIQARSISRLAAVEAVAAAVVVFFLLPAGYSPEVKQGCELQVKTPAPTFASRPGPGRDAQHRRPLYHPHPLLTPGQA